MDIKRRFNVPGKKYEKVVRKPPKGFDSANDFFEHVFMDKEMIWMGQNTNHLHDNTIAQAMSDCIMSKEYCKYPAPGSKKKNGQIEQHQEHRERQLRWCHLIQQHGQT